MSAIRSLAVFCGSRVGSNPQYAEAGRALGLGLAKAGIRLVYGGGRIGIMGIVADAVLESGGEVLGVIPDFLKQWEVEHQGVQEMVITHSMHERKTRLYDESDAFLTMPGGLGTFDETFEIVTWKQLRLHDKPILLCNIDGWADRMIAMIEHTVEDGFAAPSARHLIEVLDDVPAVLERLKWLPTGSGVPGERL
ncbi:MAG: TIGR00730 family Rossman fold protein [Acetobacteraceae bacterium]|nr:TIGR00730 family Rossman fold protein [Pseudomonadota bacterium]